MTPIPPSELFPTHRPLTPDQVFGRATDIDLLTSQLQRGAHQVVVGTQGSGTSTLGAAVAAALRRRRRQVCAVDVPRLGGPWDFPSTLAFAVLGEHPPITLDGPGLRRGGSDAASLPTVSQQLFGELGPAYDGRNAPGDAVDSPAAAWASALPEQVAMADGDKVVLLADFPPFQRWASDNRSVISPLLDALSRFPHVACLAVGTPGLLAAGTNRTAGFEERTVTPLTPDAWRHDLASRYAAGGCTVDDRALDQLIEAGGGHPRAIMLIAQTAYEEAVARRLSRITAGTVQQATRHAANRLYHKETMKLIATVLGRPAMMVMRQLASGQAPYAGVADTKAVSRAIRRLYDAGFVDQPGGRRTRWRVVDPFLGQFLAALGPVPGLAAGGGRRVR